MSDYSKKQWITLNGETKSIAEWERRLAKAQATIETLKATAKMYHESLCLNQEAIRKIKTRAERPSEDPFDAPADILAIIEALYAPFEEAKAKALQSTDFKAITCPKCKGNCKFDFIDADGDEDYKLCTLCNYTGEIHLRDGKAYRDDNGRLLQIPPQELGNILETSEALIEAKFKEGDHAQLFGHPIRISAVKFEKESWRYQVSMRSTKDLQSAPFPYMTVWFLESDFIAYGGV